MQIGCLRFGYEITETGRGCAAVLAVRFDAVFKEEGRR